MTLDEAREIIYSDDDYDDDGILKNDVKEEFVDKYAELDYMSDVIGVDDDDDFEEKYDEPYEDEDDDDED
jgi:hypothetical protein